MIRILVVEDEEQTRSAIGTVLREHDYRVLEATFPEEAFALNAEHHPELVLLDLSLAPTSGLDTLRHLRRTNPAAAIVVMPELATQAWAAEALRSGALYCLPKPFERSELLKAVERMLAPQEIARQVAGQGAPASAARLFPEIIGRSPQLQDIFRIMAKVARVDATVLISGESGTGKELVARAIHEQSSRAARPFIAVNCSAIPATLLEAEFFGYEKGSFTDARESRPGKFEDAEGGTLFLDEIGDLVIEAQAKLLRTLQERHIVRLGSSKPRPVNVRVIAATNHDLERSIHEGRFRGDLLWRLNVVHIPLPPLRDRLEDLPFLLDSFIDHFNRELGVAVHGISHEARRILLSYSWPGNVRELENSICRAMILCDGKIIRPEDLPIQLHAEKVHGLWGLDDGELPLAEMVKRAIERLEKITIMTRLSEHQGNRSATARSLGISRKTLFNKLRQYHLTS